MQSTTQYSLELPSDNFKGCSNATLDDHEPSVNNTTTAGRDISFAVLTGGKNIEEYWGANTVLSLKLEDTNFRFTDSSGDAVYSRYYSFNLPSYRDDTFRWSLRNITCVCIDLSSDDNYASGSVTLGYVLDYNRKWGADFNVRITCDADLESVVPGLHREGHYLWAVDENGKSSIGVLFEGSKVEMNAILGHMSTETKTIHVAYTSLRTHRKVRRWRCPG